MHQKMVRPRGGAADWHFEDNTLDLWDVSKKTIIWRKNGEKAYKQIEEKLGTKRAVIKVKITDHYANNCLQVLRSFACTTQQVPTNANNSQHCWAQQCCNLLRPFAWAF